MLKFVGPACSPLIYNTFLSIFLPVAFHHEWCYNHSIHCLERYIIVSKNHAHGCSHYCIACLQVVCDVVLSPHEKILSGNIFCRILFRPTSGMHLSYQRNWADHQITHSHQVSHAVLCDFQYLTISLTQLKLHCSRVMHVSEVKPRVKSV